VGVEKDNRDEIAKRICKSAERNDLTASIFLEPVQDIERFPSSKEFIRYIETYPVRVESGKQKCLKRVLRS